MTPENKTTPEDSSALPGRKPRTDAAQRTYSRRTWLASSFFGVLGSAQLALGQQPAGHSTREKDMNARGPLNVVFPTWGGKQLWADQLVYFDWRIQQNVLTGHHRLLDGEDRRQGWGTFKQCQARLTKIRQERNLPPMQGPAIIVLHGLFRTRGSMAKMAEYLRQAGDYTVLRMGYPTTRGKIADHAQTLASVVKHLEGITEINFVAHSLGNLVIRHYLADSTDAERGLSPDARIKRIVMVGAPNRGAQLAERFVPIDFTKQIAGPAAWELAAGWKELAPHLATPACEFGVLAGGNGKENGRNPFLDGDDDLVVSVESTRLPGASDFRLLPVYHTTMMNDPTVQKYTLEFIRHGYFESADTRQPIVEVAAKPVAP
jgi:pimeloyl-ACP methyl ester carboxylesterase